MLPTVKQEKNGTEISRVAMIVRLLLSFLLLLIVVFEILSLISLIIQRGNRVIFVIFRILHLLLIPTTIIIALNVATRYQYVFAASVIAANTFMLDLFLHLLHFFLAFAFIPRILSLSIVLSSGLSAIFLFLAIAILVRDQNDKDFIRNERREHWILFFAQLVTLFASAGLFLVILQVYSPSWVIIWLLAYPTVIFAATIKHSEHPLRAAIISSIWSGGMIIVHLIALRLINPPVNTVNFFLENVLDLPGGETVTLVFDVIKWFLFAVVMISYLGQFVLSLALVIQYDRQQQQQQSVGFQNLRSRIIASWGKRLLT